MSLAVESLSFRYPDHDVLNDISFSVEKGECLAVLGTNGVGKSTLLKCINRIIEQRSGKVVVTGENVRSLSGNELAKRMAYVAQGNHCSFSTVFDAVLLGRRPYIKWDVTEEDLQIVNEVMTALGLEDYALRNVDELSGGEAQKVSIARALAQQSDVLMFDEPTSNLDLKNQLEVIDIIKSIVKERGISAVVTMHDLNLALRFADRFILVKDGLIHTMGDASVVTSENILTVYGVNVEIRTYRDKPLVIPV